MNYHLGVLESAFVAFPSTAQFPVWKLSLRKWLRLGTITQLEVREEVGFGHKSHPYCVGVDQAVGKLVGIISRSEIEGEA